MFSGFKSNKLRVNLRLAMQRLKMLEKKRTEQAQKARKEIAEYLKCGKDERARIRVEHIIREDYMVEAFEIVEMYCDLMLARIGLLETMKAVDESLEETVNGLIWVAPRMHSDVAELKIISDMLFGKYGKEYGQMARINQFGKVNQRLIAKMSPAAPPRSLVENYLVEIARAYGIVYEPDPSALQEVDDLIEMGPPPSPPAFSGGGKGASFPPGGGSGASFPPGGGSGGLPYPAPGSETFPTPAPFYPPSNEPAHRPFQYPSSQAPVDYQAPPLPSKPPVGAAGGGGKISPPPAVPSYEELYGVDTKPAGSANQVLPPFANPGSQSSDQPVVPPRPASWDNQPPAELAPEPSHPPQPAPNATGYPPQPAPNDPGYPPQPAPRSHPAFPPPVSGLPDLPSVPNTLGTPPSSSRHLPAPQRPDDTSSDVDFDDLTRRFEELKKKK